jgi:hypothetical protein
MRKAVLLIKYVEAELYACETMRIDFSFREATQSSNLEERAVKKIRMDLDLSNEADFSVLLGIAEKMSPGIYVALAGMLLFLVV